MEAASVSAGTSANEQRKRTREGNASQTPAPDAPRVKRQRVSRACDQCRAGKSLLLLHKFLGSESS